MKCHLRTLAPALASLLFVAAGAPWLHGQIADAIRAHVDHSFIIGNTTLPPGEYAFRMMQDSDLEVMTVTSESDKASVDFIVRETTDVYKRQRGCHRAARPHGFHLECHVTDGRDHDGRHRSLE